MMKKNKLFVWGMAAVALTFIVVLAGCGGGGGRAAPASDFSYDLTEDGAGIKITGYTGQGGALVIPSTIEDMPVTEIGKYVFQTEHTITSVVVPDSVTVIEEQAFSRINELTKATLPDSLKEIPSNLFSESKKLTSVNLPASLESINDQAFAMCGELNELTIPASLTSVKFMMNDEENTNNAAFFGCGKLPIKTRQAIQALGYTGNF